MINIIEKYNKEVDLAFHVAISLGNALEGKSNLPKELTDQLVLNGFSGEKFRLFMNNIAGKSFINYLEVGTYCGSTAISALYGNLNKIGSAFVVDNWSEFNDHIDPRERFYKNLNRWIPEYSNKLSIIEADCFSIDKSKIDKKINLYFYDGPHTEEDHKNAFLYYNDVLDDTFIAVVDDWIKQRVRVGTMSAFKELNYEIIAEWTIETESFGKDDGANQPDIEWWNGVYIAVLKKK